MSNCQLTAAMESRTCMAPSHGQQKNDYAGLFRLVFFCGMLLLNFICASAAFGGSSLSVDEKMEIYRQGTEYFHEAAQTDESDPAAARDLYTKALLRFKRLVDEGDIKNGKLFYNIGNINFLLDDIGRAILNYRKARQYIPHNPNLAKNLAYARSMRQDKLETKEQEKILQTLFFFHYDLAAKTRLILLGFAYVSFWIFAGMKIFTRRPFTSWGLGVALLFILLFGGSLLAESRGATMGHSGVILAPEVSGRQGDADSYQPSFEEPLHAGTEFTLKEKRQGWWRIELPDGRTTWIPAKSAELVVGNDA